MNEEVTDRILTAPNVVTFIRFLLIPLYLWLLLGVRLHGPAVVCFAVAASTDWVDGQLARRTHQVSKIGKLFDPFVDRFLLAAGVISLYAIGRLPLWCVVLLVARDLVLLVETRVEIKLLGFVTPVAYVGKFATAFLMVGFGFLLLGVPVVEGFGWAWAPAWLPGVGVGEAYLGIYFLYCGIACSLAAFVMYQVRGFGALYRKHHAS